MSSREVLVVRTGTANMASVLAGLRRAGAEPRVCNDAAALEQAARVVLPGVGAFAAAMEQIHLDRLAEPIARRVTAGRPTLAICLGLQVFAAESEENPGVPGLALLRQSVRRFPDTVRVPQLGWNEVVPGPACKLLQRGYAYFANSYRLSEPPAGWAVALTDHGGDFVAAIERGRVLACQFHPELSGAWGLALLQRWLAAAEESC